MRKVGFRSNAGKSPQGEPRVQADAVDDRASHQAAYDKAKARAAQRNRDQTKAAQDIFPIPQVVNWKRRKACERNLKLFCETYFPDAFYLGWSPDHLRVIAKIEKAVLTGGLLAIAMPRGSGKTTLTRAGALWAILYGHRPFVCMIGGSRENSRELLTPIKMMILEDDLLLADFPEAVYPLRRLENSSKRQAQQHIGGTLTHVRWDPSRIVFPHIKTEHLPMALLKAGMKASPSAGSVISATSLDSHIRGQQHTRPDRRVIRPSLVLLDDPQTRESARSADQTEKAIRLINGDVLGLAGPGQTISALLTCTVCYEGDLADTLLSPDKSPEWAGERTRLVYSWPTNQELWDKYAEIRRTRGPKSATDFYRRNRRAMDAGSSVAWEARFDKEKGEISAIQHAHNLRLRMGGETFSAEYQNEPMVEQLDDQVLAADQVSKKVNGLKRGEPPQQATRVTAFVDLHDKLHYYCICAWDEEFASMAVIDYGAFPDPRRSAFTLDDTTKTLQRAYPGKGPDGAIHAGLEELLKSLIDRQFKRVGGGVLKISRIFVDGGYKPDIVAAVQRVVNSPAITMSRGRGIRASQRPMAAYLRKPGERHGEHWYAPSVRGTAQYPYVMMDVNYWKSFVHRALLTAPGDAGCMTLWGAAATNHALFAQHVARSERWVEVTGPHGKVREWSMLPGRPDNHWLDCLTGCAAAAAYEGVATPGAGAGQARRRKKYTQADLRRRA